MAETSRKSTGIGRRPPTRSISRVSRARRSLDWTAGERVPISSRKSVPPWASSNRPGREATAPVKAPFSCPKSSASASDSGSAEALTATNARSRRGLAAWIGLRDELLARSALAEDQDRRVAAGDLCDVAEASAAHRGALSRRSARQPGAARAAWRSSRFSTSRRRRSSARLRISSSSAVSIGFWKKSNAPSAIAWRACSRSPSPDIITTVASGSRCRTWRSSSSPSSHLRPTAAAACRRGRGPARSRRELRPSVASRADETANSPLSAQVSCSSRNGSSSTMRIRPSGGSRRRRAAHAGPPAIAGKRDAARACRRPAATGPGASRGGTARSGAPSRGRGPTPCGLVVSKGWNRRSRRNSAVIPAPLSMISTTARGRRAAPPREAPDEDLAPGARRLRTRSRPGSRARRRGRTGRAQIRGTSPSASETVRPAPPAPRPAAASIGRVAIFAEQAVDVEGHLDEDRVFLRDEPPGDPLQPLDGRGQQVAHGPAEVGVLPVLLEVREQEAQPEGHVLDVVRRARGRASNAGGPRRSGRVGRASACRATRLACSRRTGSAP